MFRSITTISTMAVGAFAAEPMAVGAFAAELNMQEAKEKLSRPDFVEGSQAVMKGMAEMLAKVMPSMNEGNVRATKKALLESIDEMMLHKLKPVNRAFEDRRDAHAQNPEELKAMAQQENDMKKVEVEAMAQLQNDITSMNDNSDLPTEMVKLSNRLVNHMEPQQQEAIAPMFNMMQDKDFMARLAKESPEAAQKMMVAKMMPSITQEQMQQMQQQMEQMQQQMEKQMQDVAAAAA